MRAIDADELKERVEYINDEYGHIYDEIDNMPTIEPQQRWIPVSERLPEKDGCYLTTTMYKQVYCDYWNGDYFDRTETVIAWMPLPSPYKGER